MQLSILKMAVFGGSALVPLGIFLYVVGVGGYLPGNLIIVGGIVATVGIGSFVLLERNSSGF